MSIIESSPTMLNPLSLGQTLGSPPCQPPPLLHALVRPTAATPQTCVLSSDLCEQKRLLEWSRGSFSRRGDMKQACMTANALL